MLLGCQCTILRSSSVDKILQQIRNTMDGGDVGPQGRRVWKSWVWDPQSVFHVASESDLENTVQSTAHPASVCTQIPEGGVKTQILILHVPLSSRDLYC